MNLSEGVADLHIHTTASDGTCSVTDRIEQARHRDLDAIAVTDHDIIPEELDSRVGSYQDLELVTGVEVRADVQNTKVELLGYYVDPSDAMLGNILKEVRKHRRERNRRLVNQLRNVTELDRTYKQVRTTPDRILGRPHIADVLIEQGIVNSVGAAFDEYLAANAKAFVPMERVPAARVVNAIQRAGGVVSLAHPGRIRTDDVEDIVSELADTGLDAIEVPYPYGELFSDDYANMTADDAADIAATCDLLQTGGSDCHGPDSGKFRIGQVRVNADHFVALREKAASRRSLATA